MAKRFTDTEQWDKEWYMKLPCKLKCLVKLVRDKCDLAGVWSPNWIIASAYIGEPVCETELLEIDEGNQFKKIGGGKIFCIGFIEFQYGKLSEKSPVHRKILNLLDTHKIPYQYPINRVQEKEEEKDKEEEVEKEEENEGKFNFKKSLLNIHGVKKELVEDWLKVRKTKKATNTETAFKNFLEEYRKSKLSINDVLELCINRDWKGFKNEWLNNLTEKEKSSAKKEKSDLEKYHDIIEETKNFKIIPRSFNP